MLVTASFFQVLFNLNIGNANALIANQFDNSYEVYDRSGTDLSASHLLTILASMPYAVHLPLLGAEVKFANVNELVVPNVKTHLSKIVKRLV